MKVKPHHPLAEVIAKCLFSIESMPREHIPRFVSKTCREAVKWYEQKEEELRQLQRSEKKNDNKKCIKCKCDIFKIEQLDDCSNCLENGAWDSHSDDGGYIYDSAVIAEKGLIRDYVSSEGECRLGYAYGAGCHQYICVGCGDKTHCPTYDE